MDKEIILKLWNNVLRSRYKHPFIIRTKLEIAVKDTLRLGEIEKDEEIINISMRIKKEMRYVLNQDINKVSNSFSILEKDIKKIIDLISRKNI